MPYEAGLIRERNVLSSSGRLGASGNPVRSVASLHGIREIDHQVKFLLRVVCPGVSH